MAKLTFDDNDWPIMLYTPQEIKELQAQYLGKKQDIDNKAIYSYNRYKLTEEKAYDTF